jgi:hypothetical protein
LRSPPHLLYWLRGNANAPEDPPMREVMIRDVLPGMVLAEPARDLMGNSLLEAGTALTHDHLRTLRAWGVRGILVGEEDAPAEKKTGKAAPRRRKSTRIYRQEAGGPSRSPPRSASRPVPKATTAERLRELDHIFALLEDDGLMMRIKAIAERQLRRRSGMEAQ